ncbi:MAG: sigma 54-interacting transcriptional regulator [bacterium]|nr:sigma 54-interacting transcriptional regulator [bacterium]
MNPASDHKATKVLILGSTILNAKNVSTQFEDTNIKWELCDDLSAAETKLKSGDFAVVLATPPENKELLMRFDILRKENPELEFVHFLPTNSSPPNSGRQDGQIGNLMFVVTVLSHLKATVELALKHQSMKSELFALRGQIAMSFGFDNIVGLTDKMQEIKNSLAKVAETEITILLKGPEGSGRTLIAHSLHHHSRRRHEQLVTYDCKSQHDEQSLLPEADSDTSPSVPGGSAVEQADGGTLYIKDVELLSLPQQQQLAAFLSTMTWSSGTTGHQIKIDLRLLVSSTIDLEKAVRSGSFSQELWHQINVLPISIPSLSERIDDLELLVEYSLRRITSRSESPSISISPAAIEALRNHSWPGQVRELISVLTRAAAVCRNSQIEIHDLGSLAPSVDVTQLVSQRQNSNLGIARGKLAESQKELIVKALDENDWNFTQTSHELGIGRTTLWRKVKKYNLKRDAEKSPV